MTPAQPSRRSVAAVCAVALAVRLYALGRPSLWFDELLEVERATGPWRALLFGRPIDHDPPLFALALRGWIAVGRLFGWPWIGDAVGVAAHPGWAEAWLRLPSVALGVAAVALTAVWAARWFGRRVGLLAALLLALSPLAIYHSQEVNQYAAMIAATPLLLLLQDRLNAGARRRDWLAYGTLSAAALATHYGMVFPLLALGSHQAWQAWRDPTHRADRGRVAAYAAAMAAVVAALFALGLGARMAVPHVQPRLWGTHLTKELAYIGDVGWREIVVYFPFPFAGGPAILVANALGIVALVGAVRLWRRGGGGRLLVGGYVGGTLAMTYGTSLVGWYPLGYRYGVFNLVPYVVLVAAGVVAMGDGLRRSSPDGLRPSHPGGLRPSPPDPLPQVWGRGRMLGGRVGKVAGAGSVVIAAATLVAFVAYWPHAPWTAGNPFVHVPREDVRPVLRDVAAAWRAGDRLVVYDGAAVAVRFYWRGDRGDVVELPVFSPADPDAVDRVRDALTVTFDDARTEDNPGGGGEFGRAWLILSHVDPGDEALLSAVLNDLAAPPAHVIPSDGASAWRINVFPLRP